MNLSLAQILGFAREVAAERIHEGANLDVGDEFATEPDSRDVWVTVRVLVKREDIEALAKVRRNANRPRPQRRRRQQSGRVDAGLCLLLATLAVGTTFAIAALRFAGLEVSAYVAGPMIAMWLGPHVFDAALAHVTAWRLARTSAAIAVPVIHWLTWDGRAACERVGPHDLVGTLGSTTCKECKVAAMIGGRPVSRASPGGAG
jgi:hypothetical protein